MLNVAFCSAQHGRAVVREPYGDDGHVPFSFRSRSATIRVLDARLPMSGARPVRTSVTNATETPIYSLSREELVARSDRGDFFVLHKNFIRADKNVARQIVKGMWFFQGEEVAARCMTYPVEPTAREIRTRGAYC